MCFQTPSVPSPGAVTSQTLAAQLKYAPATFAADAQFSPQYSQLSLDNLFSFLNGSADTTTNYAATGKPGSKTYIPGGSVTTPGNPGFLSLYQNQIMPALTSAQTAANTATRTANVADAAALTPGIIADERSSNPGAAGLLDQLTSRTGTELGYGTELTPAEKLQLNQSVRGGSAARGMGFGPSDVFAESLADTNMGQNLLQQRMGNAQSLVPTLQSFYGDPFAEISGMGSSAGMNASGVSGMGSSVNAPAMLSEFNGQNGLASQYMGSMGQASAVGANASNTAIQSMIGLGGGAGAGAASSY